MFKCVITRTKPARCTCKHLTQNAALHTEMNSDADNEGEKGPDGDTREPLKVKATTHLSVSSRAPPGHEVTGTGTATYEVVLGVAALTPLQTLPNDNKHTERVQRF